MEEHKLSEKILVNFSDNDSKILNDLYLNTIGSNISTEINKDGFVFNIEYLEQMRCKNCTNLAIIEKDEKDKLIKICCRWCLE